MKILLSTAMLLLSVSVLAQWTYNTNSSADTGNPGGVNTEGDAIGNAGWTIIQNASQAVNSWSPIQTIPFAFNFYGNPVIQFKASLNGLVTFDVGSVLLPSVNDNLPSANLPDSTICGFWDEFTAAAPTGTNDEVLTRVYGTAPNRQLWIKWYSFEMGNPVNIFNYYAIVLEETTNNIYIVDQYSNSTALTATVGVQLNATTAVQFGTNTFNHNSNGGTLADNDYYEFIPELLVNDNAGVISLDTPTIPLVAGLSNVDVTVQNFGTNDLTAFDIVWEINGTPQPSYVYAGPTIPAGTPSGSLNIGSYNFPSGFSTLKFWTNNPNGVSDANPSNDTLEINACTALAGTYSIGGVSPDFATINEAINALNTCGVSGPLVFNIAPGVYNELLTLTEVTGASAVNTITFDGGDATTTTVTAAASGAQWATIGHDGADYITWKNLTIETTATTDGAGVGYWNDATNNVVDSCRILMDEVTNGVNDLIGVMISGSPTSDFVPGLGNGYNTFSNNTILGGEMGIHIEGSNTFSEWTKGTVIANNSITLMDDYGIYADAQDTISITNNYFAETKATGGDGIALFNVANFNISRNEVYANDFGIYISDGNFDGPVVGQSLVANNIAKSQTDYGMYFNDVNNMDIWHNTSWGNSGIRIGNFTNLDIRNNIFQSTNNFAFESDEAIGTIVVDYNLYWTPTSNANFARIAVSTYADLPMWQAANAGANSNSVEIQPDFLGASNLRRLGPNGNDGGVAISNISNDIDGEIRPQGLAVDMGADEYTPVTDDAVASEVIPVNQNCGDSLTQIYLVVSNIGTQDITNASIGVDVSGDIIANLNATYTGPLNYGGIDTVLVGTINTYAGGAVNLQGWITLSTDTNQVNDTILGSASFVPFEPVGFGSYDCGTDTATLTALTGYNVSYLWFDSLTGGTQVGSGNSFTVPSVSTQATYFLQYTTNAASLQTTLAGGNGCTGGAMFDVVSASGSSITQIAVNCDAGSGINVPVNIHYILGSSYAGNETNAGAWTLEGNYNVVSGGPGALSSYITLTNPIALAPGQTVAIYAEYNADYTNGTTTFTNGDIQIFTGAGLCGSFSGANNGRMFNGELVFGAAACSSVRTPVSAIAVPAVTVDLGADTTVCGPNIVLDAGNSDPMTTWFWSDSLTTTQTFNVTTPGTSVHWVLVTDSVGCVGTDTVTIQLSNFSLGINPQVEQACSGDTVTITPTISSAYPYTYNWSNGDSTEVIQVTMDGAYQIVVQDSVGCADSLTSTVTFTNTPVAGFTSNLNTVDLDVTSSAADADSTVYDFGDGTVITGENLTHTYSVNDTYDVCQYVYNDCGTDTICEQVTIAQVSLDELSSSIQLNPNPATDVLTIQIEGFDVDKLEVMTTEGRILLRSEFSNNEAILNVESLPVGVYFVHVYGTSGQGMRRFIKN